MAGLIRGHADISALLSIGQYSLFTVNRHKMASEQCVRDQG